MSQFEQTPPYQKNFVPKACLIPGDDQFNRNWSGLLIFIKLHQTFCTVLEGGEGRAVKQWFAGS